MFYNSARDISHVAFRQTEISWQQWAWIDWKPAASKKQVRLNCWGHLSFSNEVSGKMNPTVFRIAQAVYLRYLSERSCTI